MSIDMIACAGCNWSHRSLLEAAECRERYDIEQAENMERFGMYAR